MSRLLRTAPYATAAVALAVGLWAGPSMPWVEDDVPGEGSVEVGFSRDMQVHHAQAVQMSALSFDRSTNPEVRAIAVDVATSQQAQIGIMSGWMGEWGVASRGQQEPMAWMAAADPANHTQDGASDGGHEMALPDGRMPGMASPQQMAELTAAKGAAFDRLYVALLAEHHAGGLSMMEAAVQGTDRPAVVSLSKAMLASQTAEMDVLAELAGRLA